MHIIIFLNSVHAYFYLKILRGNYYFGLLKLCVGELIASHLIGFYFIEFSRVSCKVMSQLYIALPKSFNTEYITPLLNTFMHLNLLYLILGNSFCCTGVMNVVGNSSRIVTDLKSSPEAITHSPTKCLLFEKYFNFYLIKLYEGHLSIYLVIIFML